MNRGTVPGHPFARVIQDWVAKQPEGEIPPIQQLADAMKTDKESVRKISKGKNFISFDTADKIVTTCLGPSAWWDDMELFLIYQLADLSFLDRTKPCVAVAAA